LAFLTPDPRDRKRTGTAVVAVELDAAGTQTAAPALRKSTGSPALDAAALRIARGGQYGFLRGSRCTPQPFTYNLELTFQ
jgi:TonB family protein